MKIILYLIYSNVSTIENSLYCMVDIMIYIVYTIDYSVSTKAHCAKYNHSRRDFRNESNKANHAGLGGTAGSLGA
jgi:hypothetical protein